MFVEGCFGAIVEPHRLGSRNADGLGRGLARIQVELCMKLSILKIERELLRRSEHDTTCPESRSINMT